MAKYWTTDLQCKVMDECLQLHGGYGYMWEYPITRAYADARVQRIYGGTNEIMKEVISRAMGLGGPLTPSSHQASGLVWRNIEIGAGRGAGTHGLEAVARPADVGGILSGHAGGTA